MSELTAPIPEEASEEARRALFELNGYLERANGQNGWTARAPEVVYDRFATPPETRVSVRVSHLDHDASLFFSFIAEATGGVISMNAGLEEGENFVYVTFTFPEPE